MAATRLSESQKREMAERFQAGDGFTELAKLFDCSPNTVSRAVKAQLDPEVFQTLRQRGRKTESTLTPSDESPGDTPEPERQDPPAPVWAPARADLPLTGTHQGGIPQEPVDDGPSLLALEDADDFAADAEDDPEEDEELAGLDDTLEEDPSVFVPIAVGLLVDDHGFCQPRPFTAELLPPSAYLLVDKTVELQARPLSEFPELGSLPPEEQERQALVVFANPRQAKRQCGRSQRVIKLPDSTLLERTAAFLLAQGISRLVIEGAVYSLPGS